MKKIVCAILALVCACAFAFDARCLESSRADEVAEGTGADELTSGEYADTGKGVFEILADSVKTAYKNVLRFFCSLLAAVLLAALLSAFAGAGKTLGAVYSLVSVIAISGTAFAFLKDLFAFASESLGRLCDYMSALIPVTAALAAAGGRTFSGVASSSALLVFLTFSERFAGNIVFPLLKTGFALSVAGSFPGSVDLRPAAGFVKSAFAFLLTLVFTLFGAVMYFQTVIGAAADSCAFRTVRFAAGAFIPVIGTMIGDAARTVTSAVGTVKATVGGAGVTAVLSLTLPAVVLTAAYKLCVLAAAALARMLGLEKESGMLYDINSFLGLLIAILAGTGTVFITAVALFIRIGTGE